jgi:peptidoglycan/LPS O-acetylase OafA/YrhL
VIQSSKGRHISMVLHTLLWLRNLKTGNDLMDNANTEDTNSGKRLFFVDNLRTFIIFMVVLYHAGWVYEPSGFLSSVWIVDDPAKNNISGLLNMVMDMFMMPTMFFISGYFAPLSLQKKNEWHFLASRFKRLMVPWLLAAVTLLPLYKVIYLYSRGLPQEGLSTYFHFNGGILINQGWLWFLPVLFLFDLLYVILSKATPRWSTIGLKAAVAAVFFIGFAYSFCMSIFNTYGWTKTVLLDFQNERLLIYFLTFLLGALCWKLKIFEKPPTSKKLYYLLCATIWIPMNVYIHFLLNLIFNSGQFIISGMVDVAIVWLGFHLSLLGLMYLFINTFRYFLNRKGKVLILLNECSFGVYVLHFIVVGAIALMLLEAAMPSIGKYVLLAITAYIASNLIVYLYLVTKERKLWRKAVRINE